MKTIILNHSMVQIVNENNEYRLFIAMKDGNTVMQTPYSGDQRGLIGAMTLAIDILAGKVLLSGMVESQKQSFEQPEITLITASKKLLGN